MKGLEEVFAEHAFTSSDEEQVDGKWTWGFNCECGAFVPDALANQHLADVVLAWVAAGLDGARPAVARALCESVNPGTPEAWVSYRDDWLRDSDAALAVVGKVLGVPQEATGADLSDEERSVGFGDGSDDEGGL